MLSSRVKIWSFCGKAHLVFHWCLYNKQNITCPLMDMNFIFSWSTLYLTSERSERVRYRVDHSKIKFISTRGHVISSIIHWCSVLDNYLQQNSEIRNWWKPWLNPSVTRIFNNYSSSPNGLWVNSPWGRRPRYWLRAHEGEKNNCFSKIQLVGQTNIETKHL